MALVDKGEMLPLMEEFYTIQGEGFHKGTAAYFIRVGGCDVGCHWCDVKESWNAETHPPTHISAYMGHEPANRCPKRQKPTDTYRDVWRLSAYRSLGLDLPLT